MIGKILLDKFGVTEFLGRDITKKKVANIPTFNESTYNDLIAQLNTLENDPVQVDLYLKAHGLNEVEELKNYILNNNIKRDSVNNLIQTQNYKNIADQAHGFKGVKNAINKYNAGITQTDFDTEKFVSTVNLANPSLGKYLSSLKDANGQYRKADAGLNGYAGSLITAAAKTVALQAATMALNTAIYMGISFVIS